MIRYPIDALAAVLEIQLGVIGAHQPGDPHTGMRALGYATGVSVSTLKRARVAGGLTEWQADRCAVAAGRLPGDVWPSWYEDGLTAAIGPGAAGVHELVERVGGGGGRGVGCPVVGRAGRLVWAVAA